jgi:hypothetical protein
MKLVVRLLTECFMLQVVALRTTYGQLRKGKQRFWSRKRRQIKRLWDLDTWFGTRRSKVQILSPRPILSSTYPMTSGPRLQRCRWFCRRSKCPSSIHAPVASKSPGTSVHRFGTGINSRRWREVPLSIAMLYRFLRNSGGDGSAANC